MINSWLNHPYHRSQLPNDVEKLKDIIDDLVPLVWHLRHEVGGLQEQNSLLQKQVEELQQQNSQLLLQNAQLQQRVSDLENQITLLKKDKFGKKSEKMPPKGGGKGGDSSKSGESPKKQHPGRQKLPPQLPRVRVEYDLSESDKVCPLCQERLIKVQEVVSEQLDVIPAQL